SVWGGATGLLEAADGRAPSPRGAPPYRHGAEEFGDDPAPSAAKVEMAAPDDLSNAPPTLANNVETLANVPQIIALGADWFRSVGTDESPRSIVCTITARTPREALAQVP